MGQITDRAEQLRDMLDPPDAPEHPYRVTCDIRDTVPPCILVVPVPRRDYVEGATQGGGFELEWTMVALGRPPADLEAARDLEELVDHVVDVLEHVERAEPASYTIPGAETAVPAYLVTYRETATEE